MLAILLDGAAGYLLAKSIRRAWLLYLAAIAAGMAIAVVANLVIHVLMESTPGEMWARIITGMFWHPIFTCIFTFFSRRSLLKSGAGRSESS